MPVILVTFRQWWTQYPQCLKDGVDVFDCFRSVLENVLRVMFDKLFQREKMGLVSCSGFIVNFFLKSTALVFSSVCTTHLKNIQSRNLEA